MSRYFRRYSSLHVNGTIGAGGALAPVVPASIDLTLGQSALNVNAGASVDVLVTLVRTNFTAAVALAVSGLPSGVSGSFSPASLTAGTLTSTLTLTAAGGAAAVDDAPITVTASGTGVLPVAKSATLDVNAAPVARTAVAIKAMRHDGLTGNTRAVGFIQFPPGAVQASDIALATAWDANGAEVGCYVEDIGARHLSAGAANGLLGAHLQLDTTFAAPGSEPAFTLKFDQPVTRPRLTAQAYTEWTQTLDIHLGSDVTKLGIGACTCHPYDQNAPIPVAAQDVTWAYTVTPTVPGTGFAVVIVRLMVRSATGQVRAYPRVLAAAATATGTTETQFGQNWYHDYGGLQTQSNVVGESCIGFVTIYVAAGTGATTIGTSALNGAGITVTTTGSGKEPYSTLPTDIPAATVAPSDPVYLCATEFPGYKLTPEATDPVPFLVTRRRQGSDTIWGRLGWFTYRIGGQPWYNNCLEEWIMYARSGSARYARRALATEKAYRTWAGPTFTGLGEAQVDSAQPLVYCALTQRPSDTLNVAAAVEVAVSRATLKQNESAEYRGHSLSGPGLYSTGRFAMHVFQVVSWYARLGIDPGAAYVVIPSQDGELWPNAASWTTVSTAQGHFARMCDRVHTSVAVDAAFSPGMRYIRMPNYDDFGNFMAGWLTSYLALALKTFGVPEEKPGGAPSLIAQDLADTVEYPFTALSRYTAEPYYVSRGNGGKAFTYETPGGAGIDGSQYNSVLANALPSYTATSWTLADATKFKAAENVRVSSGGQYTIYAYTSKTGNTLNGVSYVFGPQVAYPAGARVDGRLASSGSAGVNLNSTWLYAIAYLYQRATGATKALWKARGDALYLGLQDTGGGVTALSMSWHAKELPESDLIGSCWTAESA